MITDEQGIGWLATGLVLALSALVVWLWAKRKRSASNLPQGEIIYSDYGQWHRQSEPLYSSGLKLVGRPDYLVRQYDGAVIPVELKSGSAPDEPHEGHVFQLAAYCLLVDDLYQIRPEYGILQYRDRAFAVEYSSELEEELLDLIADMRGDMFELDLDRDHHNVGRCRGCGFRQSCAQSLA